MNSRARLSRALPSLRWRIRRSRTLNAVAFTAQNVLAASRSTIAGARIENSAISREPRLTLAAMVRVRNEGRFIVEWICHHALLGFQHFYVYDNGSTDGTRNVLRYLIESGVVTYVPWPAVPPTPSAELHFFRKWASDSEWVAFLDADEFIDNRTGVPLRELLAEHDAPALAINWRLFGSSWFGSTPAGLVTRNFRYGASCRSDLVKVIVRPREVQLLRNPHNFYYRRGRLARTIDGRRVFGSTAYKSDGGGLELRHYVCRGAEDSIRKAERSWGAEGRKSDPFRSLGAVHANYPLWNDVDRPFSSSHLVALEYLAGRWSHPAALSGEMRQLEALEWER